MSVATVAPTARRRGARQGARRRADLRRGRGRAAALARPRRRRPRRERGPQPPTDPSRVTFIVDRNLNYTNVCVTDCDFCAFYRRPGRPARGLPAAEAGHLQEDRGDARDRRHRAAHAGRPPPRPRDRLLRGPLPLDQGALHDPPARALAAGDPAHRAALEADRSRRRSRGCATRASTRSRAAAPRSSSTASARSSRRRRRRPTSGSTSCARPTGSACRRPRR